MLNCPAPSSLDRPVPAWASRSEPPAAGALKNRPLVTGLLVPDASLREQVKALSVGLPIEIVLEQSSLVDSGRIGGSGLELLIVGVGREPVESTLRRLKSIAPKTLIVVVHSVPDPVLIMDAIRAGADEFVYPPYDAGLRFALAHLGEKVTNLRPHGRLIGIVSAKGGCGATTVACHLATSMARAGARNVLLADLDVDGGIVGFMMKTRTPYTVLDAARNIHRLDSDLWKGLVSHTAVGVDVIPAPGCLAAGAVSLEPLRTVVREMRAMYGWVVADLGSGLNVVSVSLLDYVDELLVVSTPDVPSLYQGRQLIRRLAELGFPRNRLGAIFNRLPNRRDYTEDELRDFLGVPVQAGLLEFPALDDHYAGGNLASPTSSLGASVAVLAAKLVGIPGPKARKRHIFLRLPWAS